MRTDTFTVREKHQPKPSTLCVTPSSFNSSWHSCSHSHSSRRAQCNPGPIGWLSKLLRVRHTIEQPTAITYTTKPSLVYEIPFFMVVYCAFVEAGGKPYLYLWVQQNRMKEPRDMKTGDALVIHLANGATLSAACLTDYPGLKDQSIAFYPLELRPSPRYPRW